MSTTQRNSLVAYFSMEICLEEALPTYSGGLGVLAGDTLRSAADLGVPMVAVTLLHRRGYFTQHLDQWGNQTESPVSWHPERLLQPLEPRVKVEVHGREVQVRAWRYTVTGVRGHEIPVYLLDTDLPENSEYDRTITDTLYGGDAYYRLCQEVVLGMGGAKMLRALGHAGEVVHHINEGHASLLCLHLLEEHLAGRGHWDIADADLEAVRRQAVFTTHTPVPAGHDKFPADMARDVLGAERMALLESAGALPEGALNMTVVALRLTRFVNAVAWRHQVVSSEMFPESKITAITNGVHATTWTSAPFQALFDRYVPGWREDNQYLRYANTIPLDELRDAHAEVKQDLLDLVEKRTGVVLDPKALTIGFARRAATYKRADLLFTDLDRLKAVTRHTGPLQVVFGGKAHPRDEHGKGLIKRIFEASRELGDAVRVVYLENYDMALGARLTSGVDVWLNNPMRPMEASGTSGMKAALNGVPSLSILDGWWVEGCVEGVTGWAIGDDYALPQNPEHDVLELYHKLERVVLPTYYGTPYRFAEIMRYAIALNGAFFNTQRMVRQYVLNAYYPGAAMAAQQAALVAR